MTRFAFSTAFSEGLNMLKDLVIGIDSMAAELLKASGDTDVEREVPTDGVREDLAILWVGDEEVIVDERNSVVLMHKLLRRKEELYLDSRVREVKTYEMRGLECIGRGFASGRYRESGNMTATQPGLANNGLGRHGWGREELNKGQERTSTLFMYSKWVRTIGKGVSFGHVNRRRKPKMDEKVNAQK
jgi:hypothetical protein